MRKRTTSTRDAVIWSVDPVSQTCQVKVQGGSASITAHFPRNWEDNPSWLKPGNAVRVRHREGYQGYIEVVGHGRAVPSPVSGPTLPSTTGSGDTILTGMEAVPDESGDMAVRIGSGTYRIDGGVYTYTYTPVEYIQMTDPPEMTMGASSILGLGEGTGASVTLDAPPSTDFWGKYRCRYDLIVIGKDKVLEVIKGDAALITAGPIMPVVPEDHLKVAHVLVYTGMGSVTSHDINAYWSSPKPSTISIATDFDCQIDGTDAYCIYWDDVEDEMVAELIIKSLDQYGALITIGATMTVDVYYGMQAGITVTAPDGTVSTGGATVYLEKQATLTITRDQTAYLGSTLWMLRIDIAGYNHLTTFVPVRIYDSDNAYTS